ncbi:MAG: hypothetical protein MI864_11660 [Pseudomonadales bacterium]|nr:hypothetical protein [Pseudomonadales bacterium]
MTQMYFCQPTDTLDSIYQDLKATYQKIYPNTTNNDNLIENIKILNPQISQRQTNKINRGDFLILPDSGSYSANTAAFQPAMSPLARENLAHLSSQIGGCQTAAIAEVIDQIQQYIPDMNTFGGAGLGAAATRAGQFVTALDKYDRAIFQYESLRNSRAAPNTLAQAKNFVNQSFNELQIKFNAELQKTLKSYVSKTQSSTLYAGTSRARTVFRSIPVANAPAVRSLVNLGKYAKILGPAGVTLDGYFRYESVMDVYRNGGNWKREAVAQGLGFGVGVGLGFVTFSILLGPLGFVIGILVAGTAAVLLDKSVVHFGRSMYDRLTW